MASGSSTSWLSGEGPEHRRESETRCKRVLVRVFVGVASAVALIVLLGMLLYEFGGMSGSVYPGMQRRYDQLVASAQAAPIQKRFVIPIPGCRCHSDDPVLTAQHAYRRMSECGQCHGTSP
jgi:hypothetical protein